MSAELDRAVGIMKEAVVRAGGKCESCGVESQLLPVRKLFNMISSAEVEGPEEYVVVCKTCDRAIMLYMGRPTR
jgi:hypothetical protein